MINKQRFKQFLEEHGAYEAFVGLIESNFIRLDFGLYVDDELLSSSDMVIAAYAWDDSGRGNKYWSNLSDKWQEVCNEDNNQPVTDEVSDDTDKS